MESRRRTSASERSIAIPGEPRCARAPVGCRICACGQTRLPQRGNRSDLGRGELSSLNVWCTAVHAAPTKPTALRSPHVAVPGELGDDLESLDAAPPPGLEGLEALEPRVGGPDNPERLGGRGQEPEMHAGHPPGRPDGKGDRTAYLGAIARTPASQRREGLCTSGGR